MIPPVASWNLDQPRLVLHAPPLRHILHRRVEIVRRSPSPIRADGAVVDTDGPEIGDGLPEVRFTADRASRRLLPDRFSVISHAETYRAATESSRCRSVATSNVACSVMDILGNGISVTNAIYILVLVGGMKKIIPPCDFFPTWVTFRLAAASTRPSHHQPA